MIRAAFNSLLVGLALAAAGCSHAAALSPVAPSAAPSTATLTVRVVSYADHASPIAHAQIAVDDVAGFRAMQTTDASGATAVAVPIGVELTVRAGADGFASFTASGTLAHAETWTFYLTEGQGDSR